VQILAEPLIDFAKARETVAKMLIASKKYGFFVKTLDEKKKEITFFATAEVSCENGHLTKNGDEYRLQIDGESATVKIGGEEITLYGQSIEYPVEYNVSFNWAATAEKYSVNADGRAIVEPYYEIICNEKERNFKQAIIDLQKLQSFIWRTEAVVTKERTTTGTQVKIVMPNGVLKTDAETQEEKIDETAKIYTIKTNAKTISLEAETEKGSYQVILYL
jgi:hypothetical protein